MDKFKRINWVDGMLINKEHFKGMENYLLSCLYHTNQLLTRQNSYGVINPGLNQSESYPVINISIDTSDSKNQQIIVEQIGFLAITPEGTLIDISNDSFLVTNSKNPTQVTKPLSIPVEEKKIGHGDPIYLVLLTLPFETTGTGNGVDIDEPLRMPYCRPVSELRCISSTSDVENIIGANHFPIAKFKIINHRLKIDEDYIPPCFSLSASNALRERFFMLKSSISDLGSKLEKFLKANNRVSNDNVDFIKEIYTYLYFKIIDTRIYFDEYGESIKPLEVVRFVKTIAIQFKSYLSTNPDSFTFFMDEWNSKYGINFQNITNEIEIVQNYKHYDINESLNASQKILDNYFSKICDITSYGSQRPRPPQPPPSSNEENIDYNL